MTSERDRVVAGKPRRCLRLLLLALALFAAAGATSAGAEPILRVDLHHYPTDFAPGSTGDYAVEVANVGDTATSGPLSLRIALPADLGRVAIAQNGAPSWSCPGAAGDRVTTCTTTGAILRHSVVRNLILTADVAPTASGSRFATAELEGGGAAASAMTIEPTSLSADQAPFGIVDESFGADWFEADAITPVREAAAHPDQMVISLDLNTRATRTQIAAAGAIRHFQLELPPGFLGNPTAVGQCTPAELTAEVCPASSQVGRIELATGPFERKGLPKTYTEPVFNMQHPHGALADLAFAIAGNPGHVKFSLDPANHYAIVASANDINEAESLLDLRMTLWGIPADHGHDSERCGAGALDSIDTSRECPSDLPAKPFLTLPADCSGEQAITLGGVDSWQQPGIFAPEIPYRLPGAVSNCERPHFEPSLEVTATSRQSDTPTGLDLRLIVPQDADPNAPATPPVRDLHLTLPAGVRISPSAADGLASCTPTEIGLGTNDPVACPDASRLGEATLTTPLLPKPLSGFLYLATPRLNPTNSLFAVYLVVRDAEDRAVLLKLPGKLDLDPSTGQITAVFEDLPPLPFDELELDFHSGSHAPLLSGPECGPQTVTAAVASWAQPADPVHLSQVYTTDQGPSGVPCTTPTARPFAPAFSGGTVAPIAGAATPFVFTLTRTDPEAPLSHLSATLPPGVSVQVAGVPTCPEDAIAAIPTEAGAAIAQLGAPGCPADSRLGTATIAVGAGPAPLYLNGSVYLTGRYREAPYSLFVIVPALAGPFDLGVIASRIAVDVNPNTAQLHLRGQPVPMILAGVPVDVRQVSLLIDRPGLIRNPTSCDPLTITGTSTSTFGQAAPFSQRFQVGNCANLTFRPRLHLRASGSLGRGGHPALRSVIDAAPHEAALAAASFTLPAGELLDLHRLRDLCSRALPPQSCPAASQLGYVRLRSSILTQPLKGRVYLREPRHRLPDLIGEVQGGGVHLILHGHTATRHGRLLIGFDALPDLPLAKAVITVAGGRHGVIVNSRPLCARPTRVITSLVAQNAARRLFRPYLRLRC